MSLQVDGNATIEEQERQLQAVETFFVEVIDYRAGEQNVNGVTTRDLPHLVDGSILLRQVPGQADLAGIIGNAAAIVFDRMVFVEGELKRVVGIRE